MAAPARVLRTLSLCDELKTWRFLVSYTTLAGYGINAHRYRDREQLQHRKFRVVPTRVPFLQRPPRHGHELRGEGGGTSSASEPSGTPGLRLDDDRRRRRRRRRADQALRLGRDGGLEAGGARRWSRRRPRRAAWPRWRHPAMRSPASRPRRRASRPTGPRPPRRAPPQPRAPAAPRGPARPPPAPRRVAAPPPRRAARASPLETAFRRSRASFGAARCPRERPPRRAGAPRRPRRPGGVATPLGGGRFASHRGRLEFRRVPGSARLRRLRPRLLGARLRLPPLLAGARDLGAAGRLRGLNRGARLGARASVSRARSARGSAPRRALGRRRPRPLELRAQLRRVGPGPFNAVRTASSPRAAVPGGPRQEPLLPRRRAARGRACGRAPRLVVEKARARRARGQVVDQLVVVGEAPAARRGLRYRLGDEAPRALPLDKFGLEQVGELGYLLDYIVRQMRVDLVKLGVGRRRRAWCAASSSWRHRVLILG